MKDQGNADVPPRIPLGPEDRAILALECETVAGHTCKVMRLGPSGPSVTALRERIAERIHLTPALTRRLSDGANAPAWEPDPDFDLAQHVVEHRHQRPVDPAGLLKCVARLFEQRLDRSRPLWQMDVIELEQDECALVWRIHHALADGTTSIRYSRALLWDDAPEQTMTPAQAIALHAKDEARRRGHLAGYLRREFKRSPARSPFDGPIGACRGVGFATTPLAALHDAAKAIDGASLNDAVLTIVAGAIGHWVHRNHGRTDSIRVKVPVSMHHEGDAVASLYPSCPERPGRPAGARVDLLVREEGLALRKVDESEARSASRGRGEGLVDGPVLRTRERGPVHGDARPPAACGSPAERSA